MKTKLSCRKVLMTIFLCSSDLVSPLMRSISIISNKFSIFPCLRMSWSSLCTFQKAELHAASHRLLFESGHIVIFVDDTHFNSEALTMHWRPDVLKNRWRSKGHLQSKQTHYSDIFE